MQYAHVHRDKILSESLQAVLDGVINSSFQKAGGQWKENFKENLQQEIPFARQQESMLGHQSEVRGRQSVSQTHASHSINMANNQSKVYTHSKLKSIWAFFAEWPETYIHSKHAK